MTTEKALEYWRKQKPVGMRGGKNFWITIERCIKITLQLENDIQKGKTTVVTTMENIQEHYDDLAIFERNKAIDDFAEKISLEISKSIIWGIIADLNKYDNMNDTSDKIVDYVVDTSKKIAKQLKEGINYERDFI